MEAFLFTLDIGFLILLLRAVQKLGRHPDPNGTLGMFAYLENKGDEVQGGKRPKKTSPPHA
jgi:hypothetical protein